MPANHATDLEPASQIALPWVIRLRYAMSAGQAAAAVLARYVLHLDLPLEWMLPVTAAEACSNYWLTRKARRPGPLTATSLVFAMLLFDTICMTLLLMLSGGATNPFSLLYLVNVTLSATILTKRQTWLLGLSSALGFGLLFLLFRPVPALTLHHGPEGGNLHLMGMWIGFNVTALLVVLFSARISQLLREHEASMLQMQEELAKKERLASLVTLAAGAAHELSTPLGTIAIVAREMERMTASLHPAVAADSKLIRSEVNRCREILERLSVRGAAPGGESPEFVPVRELFQRLAAQFAESPQVRFLPPSKEIPDLHIPLHAVEQALIVLIKNGLEAGEGSAPVHVDVAAEVHAGTVRFLIEDHGAGMSSEILRRIGEPFFTTKEPGKGMGLGVFLARGLADQLGGHLTFASLPGEGTTALLELPVPALQPLEAVCK